MATEPEPEAGYPAYTSEPQPQPPPQQDEEEEGGGPVKTFLEHLEDLRWTLIKSISAILVAMLLCLIGGRYLVLC